MITVNLTMKCDAQSCTSWAPITMYLAASFVRDPAIRLDKMSFPEGWIIRPDPDDKLGNRLQTFCPEHVPV